MATYTQNYTLHQWEDSDDFLRTDFNTDFAKIDTALGRAERSATSNAYNIYNLMLQNYYEGKYTGYKSALLFDGFMDDSQISALTDGMYVNTSSAQVQLDNVGQQTVTDSNFGNSVSMSGSGYNTSFYLNTTAHGTLQSFRIYFTGTLSYIFSEQVDGSYVSRGSGSVYSSSYSDPYEFALNCPVSPGGTYQISLNWTTWNSGGPFYVASSSMSVAQAGQWVIEPTPQSQGTLTAVPAQIGDYSRAMLWVHYTNGAVTATLNGQSMELVEESQGVSLGSSTSCTERYFLLDTSEGDATTLALQLTAPDNDWHYLHEYGLIFL